MCGSRSGRPRATLDIGGFRPSTAISRLARKFAAPNLSFGEFARIDAMIGGPHAQSILYNLVATSRDRYYSAELKERLGSSSPMRTWFSTSSACAAGIR